MKKYILIISLLSLFITACDNDGGSQSQTETPPAMEAPAVMEAPAMPEQETGAAGDTTEATADMPDMATEPVAEEAPAVQAMTGEQVFKKHCFACHMTGAANAPKVGDAQAWAPRIDKGMDALVMSALNGVPNTAMPPKGTCGSCSEQELQAAIDFMINQSR
jgi:cytochrome c5